MRKALVISLALASSLVVTACQSKHSGAAKAKTKVELAKVTKDHGKQKKNVKEIEASIQKQSKELEALGFTGLKDGYSFKGAMSAMTGVPSQNVAKIKDILGNVKGEAEAMIEAGKDLKGSEGDQAKACGEQLKMRVTKGIEQMNAQEKKDKENAESLSYE